MRAFMLAIVGVMSCSSIAVAAKRPLSIDTNLVPDKRFPATMSMLHVPSHGVTINGVVYLPVGPGPHPVLVICHGLPGNEKTSIWHRLCDEQVGSQSRSITVDPGAVRETSALQASKRMPWRCWLTLETRRLRCR